MTDDPMAELHNLIPAGKFRPMTESWNRAQLAKTTKPLPESFIKAAVAQGSLVPPHTGIDRPAHTLALGICAVALACIIIVWAIINFMPV